ncbi:hypothetical protein AB0M36_13985 [Actinoplanes sp. NPDC051346]|uniref:hypothetical protein n=1 Tax=Actinoplanes sp. NPDC051346 TaxID=3155048 RepID=UPI0034260875
MAAALTGVRGLGTEELQMIRDALAAGRKPKVVFTESAGQIAGQLGQVVALTDPAESDEWVVVRFGRDELPFAPADLQVAPKGATARRAAPPPPAPPVRPEPEFVIDKPAPPARGGRTGRAGLAGSGNAAVEPGASASASASASAGRAGSGGSDAESTRPDGGAVNGRARSHTSASGSGGAASSAELASRAGADPAGDRRASGVTAPAPRKASGRAAKPKPPPGLTVTLAYTEGEWTVAANQGTKALAKPYVIRPAEAMRMVSLVDVPGVQEAVEQIVAAERAQAEQQAQRLRAELAEIEARLRELEDAG